MKRNHKYDIVDPNPWGWYTGIGIGGMGMSIASRLNRKKTERQEEWMYLNVIVIVLMWVRDVTREGSYMGRQTKEGRRSIVMGFWWMMVTEGMLFSGLIGTYIYSRWTTTIWIGGTWPKWIKANRKAWTATGSLVTSGITVTCSVENIRKGRQRMGRITLSWTVILGSWFVGLQYTEYKELVQKISDGISGGTFYIITGFHSGHVIVGLGLLLLSGIRLFRGTVSRRRKTGLECISWYWHFVDVVWLLIMWLLYRY